MKGVIIMTNTTTSIINVTVNGMKATEGLKNVQSRLESVEKSAFNIALIAAYSTGVTIPPHTDSKGNEHAEAVCEKPLKQADFIKLVGRSKATLSRWIKAMNLIIENNRFNDFASGKYPFSYDKIIEIFGNKEVFEGYVLVDLMSMSASTLESMVNDYKVNTIVEESTEENNNESTSEESTKEDNTTNEIETAVLTYNGKDYTVPKKAFEEWLHNNVIPEK